MDLGVDLIPTGLPTALRALRRRQGRIDSTGKIAFRNLDSGSYDWVLTHSGRPVVEGTVIIAEGLEVVPLPCDRLPRILGVVRDSSGEPIEGAAVSVSAVNGVGFHLGLDTNAQGEFRVGALPPDAVYTVRVDAPGFAEEWSQPLRFAPGRLERALTFDLSRTQSVRGRVLDEDGTPVEGADITLFGWQRIMRTTSDRNGEFVVDGLRERPWTLVAEVPDRVTAVKVVEAGPDDPPFVELVAERGVYVQGRVQTADGLPCIDARLEGFPSRSTSLGTSARRASLCSAHVEKDGSFALGPLPSGPVELVEGRTGFGATVMAGDVDVAVVLPRMHASDLHVRVQDERTGRALTGRATYSIRTAGLTYGSRQATLDEDGRATLRTRVIDSTIDLELTVPGYTPAKRSGLMVGGPTDEECVIALAPSPEVTLELSSSLGVPLTTSSVSITWSEGASALVGGDRVRSSRPGASGRLMGGMQPTEEGLFRLDLLGRSDVEFTARASCHFPAIGQLGGATPPHVAVRLEALTLD